MASYVVLEPPEGDGRETLFVRDGFHFLALVLPLPWLLFNRLWIESLLVLLAGFAIGALGSLTGYQGASMVLSLLVAIFVGLEGAALKVAARRRRGWREAGVVEADGLADAETRYFANPSAEETPPAPPASPLPPAPGFSRPSGPALGLFSYPGRN